MRGLCFCAAMFAGAFLIAQDKGEVNAYCSLDAEYSTEIFKDFEKATGIRVIANMDTEDNKTIAMVNKIISEKNNPRCDVYWNNEVGHTMRLKNMGLLHAYTSPNAADIPAHFKDPDGLWTGLAARGRVIIYNKDAMKGVPMPTSMLDLAKPEYKGKVTMAKPLTGTTYTHFALLFHLKGEDWTKQHLRDLKANDVFFSLGNATVMRDVGEGRYLFGMTDTDDAYVGEVEKKYPVGIIVPDQDNDLGALMIPNSVMIVKGAKNLDNARTLVDYILSREVEEKLAHGRSAQIPLHPGVSKPAHVLDLTKVKSTPADWEAVGRMIEKHTPYLEEFFHGGGAKSGSKSYWTIGIVAVAAVIGLAILGARQRASA